MVKYGLCISPQWQLRALKKAIQPGKVVILYGPRRAGKTTLLHHFLEDKKDYLLVSGDDRLVHEYLASQSIEKLRSLVGTTPLLVIDEAQKIDQIGLNLKLLVDHFPDLSIIATGSSTFELARQVGEPTHISHQPFGRFGHLYSHLLSETSSKGLHEPSRRTALQHLKTQSVQISSSVGETCGSTGRKKVLKLFPLSQMELSQIETVLETRARLENRLVYGSYPEVVLLASDVEKGVYLNQLANDYLYKGILDFEGIKKSRKLIDLLQLIAFQIGKEVSYTELGKQLGMSKGTVERYLDLLEQAFVLVNVRGFSRNLRSEITKTSRYYFYDVGMRNALINNFNPLSTRNDVGELWKNYLVIERLKKQHYCAILSNNYFWRTYDQKEIDWIEEREGKLFAFEFKWKAKKVAPPKLWSRTYPDSRFEVIHQDNYLEFIMD